MNLQSLLGFLPANMSESSYEQSQNGYDAQDKRDEMYDPASRIILAYASVSSDIAGFSVFRFDMEDTAEDDRQVAVVYWCVILTCNLCRANPCAATRCK